MMNTAVPSHDRQSNSDDQRTAQATPRRHVTRAVLMVLVAACASAGLWFTDGTFANAQAPTPTPPPSQVPFNASMTKITFSPTRPDSPLPGQGEYPCYDGKPFMVSPYEAYIGFAPAGTERSRTHITGRPVDGAPDEVVEKDLFRTTRDNYDERWELGSFWKFELPPSFAGRDIVWTATLTHPYDTDPSDNTVEAILPACKG